MNVSLPKLAAHAMPAKTFLPGTGAPSGNFSTLLAEAQDSSDSSVADTLSRRSGNAQKKMIARGDKDDQSDTKTLSAPLDPTLSKAAAVNPAALESKPALINKVLPVAADISQKEVPHINDFDAALAAKESASGSVVAIPAQLTLGAASTIAAPVAGTKPTDVSVYPIASGAVISGQSGANQADSPDRAQDSQQTGVSSTTMLSTWMAGDEATSLKSGVLPSPVNLEPSATPNGKPANTQPKAASAETTRGTTSTLDTKVQADFTFLQSHAASLTPPSHVAPDAPRGQQEKPVAPASSEAAKSEAHKKEFDGAGNGATQLSKVESSLSGAAPANGAGPQAVTAAAASAPGSAVSMQMSPTAVDGHAGGAAALPKTSNALPHSQPMVDPQDAEGTPETASLSANSPLHTAKLIAGMEQSELRVGLRSGEFGNVDIRTSLVRNQFTAEILVERSELGRALAAELPSLQHRLTEQHLPSANVTVQDHSSGGSPDFRQGSRSDQGVPAPASVSGDRAQQEPILAAPPEAREASARLDIHM